MSRKNSIVPPYTPSDLITKLENSTNYFLKAWERGFEWTSDNLAPLDVVQTYIRQHNEFVLRREWGDCLRSLAKEDNSHNDCSANQTTANETFSLMERSGKCQEFASRKFIMATVNAPAEAGNRIHRFLNAYLQAIRTNRTILWRYYDYEGCLDEPPDDLFPRSPEAAEHCKNKEQNSSGFNDVLQMAPWVPSFYAWNATLNFDRPTRASEPASDPWIEPFLDNNTSPRILRIGKTLTSKPGLLIVRDPGRSLQHEANINRSIALVRQVPSYFFLYGMLFESVFTIQPNLLPDASCLPERNNTITVFLHSRHPADNLDGTYTYPEHLCLTMMLQNHTTPCHVFVMSDRNFTVQFFQEHIPTDFNCSVSVANTEVNQNQWFRKEHGPFSGMGFFQDVALAREARSGGVTFHMHQRDGGTIRTSSSLIRSQIEFRRVMEMGVEQFHRDGYRQNDFRLCVNPWKQKADDVRIADYNQRARRK